MSKSEYKRLEVQIPDVVKTIRRQVLDEVSSRIQRLEIDENFSGQAVNGYVRCKSDALEIIERLKDE